MNARTTHMPTISVNYEFIDIELETRINFIWFPIKWPISLYYLRVIMCMRVSHITSTCFATINYYYLFSIDIGMIERITELYTLIKWNQCSWLLFSSFSTSMHCASSMHNASHCSDIEVWYVCCLLHMLTHRLNCILNTTTTRHK